MTTRRTKIAALVAGCAVVAGGGYAAADALSSPSQPATSDAAALSSAVGNASLSATGTATSSKARKRGALAGLRRLPGEYGQYTYQTRKGQKVLAFERGTLTSVSSTAVTVKAANGHTENWTLTGKSAVREAGKKTSASSLADGQKVIVAGPVTASGNDARVIVIRDKGAKSTQKSTATTTS